MTDEQLEKAIDRLDDEIYRLRAGSQFSSSAQGRIAQMSVRLNKLIEERDERGGIEEPGLFENPSSTPVYDLKKFPKGSEIAGKYDQLSIWGDKMALVEAPYYDTTHPGDFDRYNLAMRYRVWLTDIPVEEQSFRQPVEFARGDLPMDQTSFTYRPTHGMGRARGRVDKPVDYWVDITKLKDLGSSQRSAVQSALEEKGYKEQDSRYPLSATKWKKLLAMDYLAAQDQDSDQANAAYYLINSQYVGARRLDEDEEIRAWKNMPGIFGTTKKGVLKFIISRNPDKKGL